MRHRGPPSVRTRTEEGNREIRRLCKPSRNFHSSAVLLCLCAQEESHGRRRPQPPLAELTPSAPRPPPRPPRGRHHHHRLFLLLLLPGRARDQPVRVGAREPGTVPGAGAHRVLPAVPGSGRDEDGPPSLLLQRAGLPHAAQAAGADLLRDRDGGGERESQLWPIELPEVLVWSLLLL